MGSADRHNEFRRHSFARGLKRLMLVAVLAPLAGCASPARPLRDDEQIVRSVLSLLASDGQRVCLDGYTEKDSLAVFREMRLAPRASRSELHWYEPRPLHPDLQAATGPLQRGEFAEGSSRLREPGATPGQLPPLRQWLLTGAARQLSSSPASAPEATAIRSAWAPRGVITRWWPLNRMRGDCQPLFILGDPVFHRSVGFVAVRAEHWGTIYAVEKRNGGWFPTAEWSRWLY